MTVHTIKSLAIEGPARSGKTEILVEKAVTLLTTESPDTTLILCSNFYRKAQFTKALQNQLSGGYPQLPITTYSALVRNTLALYWPLVEEILGTSGSSKGKSVILPELSGFEASEYLVKKIVAHLTASNPDAFASFQGPRRSLVKQLLRRIRLRSENRLLREDMRDRSRLIEEICVAETDQVLGLYDTWSAQLRVLDNSRQMDVFHYLLAHQPVIQKHFQERLQHLIADDIDETIPAQQHFIRRLAPGLKTLIIASDLEGGTRRGYLNAYPYDWQGLKALKPDLETLTLTREDGFSSVANQLLHNWKHPEDMKILPSRENLVCWQAHTITRLDMLTQVINDITEMLKQGKSPGDFSIIMPLADPLARMFLTQQLKRRGIALQVLTGTQRPTDHPICHSLLLLIQLANQTHWQLYLSTLEFKALLRQALKLHQLDAEGLDDVVNVYREGVNLGLVTLPEGNTLNSQAAARYQTLRQWLQTASGKPLDEQIYSAFSMVLTPWLSEQDRLTDVQQVIRSLYIEQMATNLYGSALDQMLAAKEWLVQIKTGIVADTPNKPRQIEPNAIVLGTPQKIIDFEIERPIHFWLDCTARDWSRTDMAPLYNAWVHSVNWDNDASKISDVFHQSLARTRAGHITRTLALYASQQICLYASELDDEGSPHTGCFQHVLKLPSHKSSQAIERAVLRTDQLPILSYQGGPMAITAVPGAGKTFVNVELVIELVERGVPADQILVLTYMDSAAKTILSRFRAKLGMTQTLLPTVCTIHSLAFRILTEDDHGFYLGLDTTDIEIADDIDVRNIIEPLFQMLCSEDNYFSQADTILSGIQFAKSLGLSPHALKNKYLESGLQSGLVVKFIQIYEAYQTQLLQQGKLDFTDLILNAIQLLESKPEIREKYQQRFQYLIEDEAQDSSQLLQRFLKLLTASHTNLIRTGDTNQSITTTFSTADTSVFRNFIKDCDTEGLLVEMDHSARSADAIIQLANCFIRWAAEDDLLKQAFQPVIMKPVAGKNPPLLEPISRQVFESSQKEIAWLAGHIQSVQDKYPHTSMTVLVRSNSEVHSVAQALQAAGIKTICQSDHPEMNPVFMLVVAILKFLEKPDDKEVTQNLLIHLNVLSLSPLPSNSIEEAINAGPLLRQNAGDLSRFGLLQLYYNLQDLMRDAYGQDMCRLMIRLADMFFEGPEQRSIAYLCALKAQRWVEQYFQEETHVLYQKAVSPLEVVNQSFSRCLEKKRLPFRGGLDVSELLQNPATPAFVLVMTLHKAKGQEFDFVWIPGMHEKAFPSAPGSAWLRAGEKLELEIELLLKESAPLPKVERELLKKIKKVEEEARLVYVGITRAKKGLFLSCPLSAKDWRGRQEALEPSRYFYALDEIAGATTITPKETAYV